MYQYISNDPKSSSNVNGNANGNLQRPSILMNGQKQNPYEKGFMFGAAESELIQSGLIGAYGEKIMESGSKYVQSNMSRYFSDPQYYFQVNDDYVMNKLKVILFPFTHKGQWTRITEPVHVNQGKLSYKPPIYDINAPDLYIPLMAFVTYIFLSGLLLGLLGRFSPEALHRQFTKGVLGWILQVMLLKGILHSLGNDETPLLDIVSYSGYAFAGAVISVAGRIILLGNPSYYYYTVVGWECLCMAVFLVKIMKRVVFTEGACRYKLYSTKRHYLLLLVAVAQIPLLFWLCNIY
ncbi:hypothetical protein MKX03_012903 [Papaver bracteatum]|nr:hypothetical protein MKX03_012903 [Papaver bracteatum]